MTKQRVLLLAIVSAGLVSGCTTSKVKPLYTGPQRPMADVATLHVPSTVILLEVDGKAAPRTPLLPGGGRFAMLPGKRVLSIRYQDIVSIGNDDYEKVRSEAITLELEAERGVTYAITHPQPDDLKQARKLADDFTASIEIIARTAGATPSPIKADRAPSPSQATLAPTQPARERPDVAAERAHDTEDSPTDMLKFWWQKASPAERASFKAWMEQP